MESTSLPLEAYWSTLLDSQLRFFLNNKFGDQGLRFASGYHSTKFRCPVRLSRFWLRFSMTSMDPSYDRSPIVNNIYHDRRPRILAFR